MRDYAYNFTQRLREKGHFTRLSNASTPKVIIIENEKGTVYFMEDKMFQEYEKERLYKLAKKYNAIPCVLQRPRVNVKVGKIREVLYNGKLGDVIKL